MKRLLLITGSSIGGVLLLTVLIPAGINLMQGLPVAHASGIRVVVLRDMLVTVAVTGTFVGYAVWLG